MLELWSRWRLGGGGAGQWGCGEGWGEGGGREEDGCVCEEEGCREELEGVWVGYNEDEGGMGVLDGSLFLPPSSPADFRKEGR